MVALQYSASLNCYVAASNHSLLSPLKSWLSFSSPPPSSLPFSLSHAAKLSAACPHLRYSSAAVADDRAKEQQPRKQVRSPDLVALEYRELNLPHRIVEVMPQNSRLVSECV